MAEFDEVAYDAACRLFREAKRVRRSIPSLAEQVDDALDMLGAQRYDGASVSGGGGNRVEQSMVDMTAKHASLIARLNGSRDRYAELGERCEAALADMEEHLEGDALDSTMLRYYYVMDLDVPTIRRKLERRDEPYSESYLYQKKEIALVRVAAAVRRLHFLSV